MSGEREGVRRARRWRDCALADRGWRVRRRCCALATAPGRAVALDDFEDARRAWTRAAPRRRRRRSRSRQRRRRRRQAMRLDFDFHGAAATSIVRRALALDAARELRASRFQLARRRRRRTPRVQARRRERRERLVAVAARLRRSRAEWQRVRIKKRQLRLRLGAAGGGELGARRRRSRSRSPPGSGGKGSVWIDELRSSARPPRRARPARRWPARRRPRPATDPPLVLDGDPATAWRSGALAGEQWLQLDLGERARVRRPGHRLGPARTSPPATRSQLSDDGEPWTTGATRASDRQRRRRDYVYLPDAEARYLRLALERSQPRPGLRRRRASRSQPLAFSAHAERLLRGDRARRAAAASIREYFLGEQTYWTVVGVDGDARRGAAQRGRACSRSARARSRSSRSCCIDGRAGDLGRRRARRRRSTTATCRSRPSRWQHRRRSRSRSPRSPPARRARRCSTPATGWRTAPPSAATSRSSSRCGRSRSTRRGSCST